MQLDICAEPNMSPKLLTRITFQLLMSALKAVADWKVEAMVVTDAVFHLEMSPLNVGLLQKSWYMLVTAAVFQPPMLLNVFAAVVGLVAHDVTAVPMFVSVMKHVSEAHAG